MSVVNIYIQVPAPTPDAAPQSALVGTVDEGRIKAHSRRVRDVLNNVQTNAVVKDVTLIGAAPPAIQIIIHRIKGVKPSGRLHVKVHDLPLERVAMVYQAAELLQVEPAQPHIEGHVMGAITHTIISASEMVALHRVFNDGANTYSASENKVWRHLVNQIAWNMVHGKIEEPLISELQTAAEKYPHLLNAIDKRLDELKEKKRRHEDVMAMMEERKQRKADRAADRAYNKQWAEKKRAHEQKLAYEKANGLRAISEEEVRRMMGRW